MASVVPKKFSRGCYSTLESLVSSTGALEHTGRVMGMFQKVPDYTGRPRVTLRDF